MRTISPKVLWPVVLGLLLSSLLSNINLITPDMLNFLGPWKFFVLQVVTTILGGLVGYKVTDPARNAAEAAKQPSLDATSTTLYTAPETVFPAAKIAAAQAAATEIPLPPAPDPALIVAPEAPAETPA